jgi:hypothetical protein
MGLHECSPIQPDELRPARDSHNASLDRIKHPPVPRGMPPDADDAMRRPCL